MRATAVLAAARLKAAPLGLFVRRVELPRTGREGLDAAERGLLRELHHAALLLLAGQEPPPDTAQPPSERAAAQTHLLRCAAGLTVAWHDGAFLLAHALTTPLPALDLPPPVLPPGIVATDAGYRLVLADVELVWVPPVAHWLGDDASGAAGPIRKVTPATGFFIARRPLAAATLARLIDPAAAAGETHGYGLCGWEEARRACERLGEQTGLSIGLPTADEWEMTARGPDVRRFPWGNGYEPGMLQVESPWGAIDTVGGAEQWTATRDKRERPLVCGGDSRLRCAWRRAAAEQDVAAIRPVMSLSTDGRCSAYSRH